MRERECVCVCVCERECESVADGCESVQRVISGYANDLLYGGESGW